MCNVNCLLATLIELITYNSTALSHFRIMTSDPKTCSFGDVNILELTGVFNLKAYPRLVNVCAPRMFVSLLLFYVVATSKVIAERVPTCASVHSW